MALLMIRESLPVDSVYVNGVWQDNTAACISLPASLRYYGRSRLNIGIKTGQELQNSIA